MEPHTARWRRAKSIAPLYEPLRCKKPKEHATSDGLE
jgi:hypothetical protein